MARPVPTCSQTRSKTRSTSRVPAALPLTLLLALTLTLTLTLAGGATYGQDHATRHGIFIDTIDVNLVNIEVTVVNSDGNPVPGLTRDDFELFVDGEPVEITNFFAVREGDRVVPSDELPAKTVEVEETEPEATPEPTAQRAPEERRFVILYVDHGNLAPNHRKRVFDELEAQLALLMQPADRVMVVGQNGELTIEQRFTSDPSLVRAAIERMSTVVGRGALLAMEPRLIQRDIERGDAPPGADVMAVGTAPAAAGPFGQNTVAEDARRTFSRVTSHAQAGLSDSRRTIKALSRFVQSLVGLPGRKAIVYVSDGLNLAPAEYLFRIWDSKYNSVANSAVGIANIDNEIDRYRVREEFGDLIAQANANRVAFYTIEGGSTHGFGDVSAETAVAVVDTFARTADSEREESLRSLAHDTGGVPLLNSSGMGALLVQLERDFNNYYSLGYPSPHRGDGKYHRVRVELKKEGLKARFLEGYRDKDADSRMNDQTLAALLHDVGDNPLEVQVEIGELAPVEGHSTFVVPVMVKIPMSNLVLIPQDQAYLGRLSIYLAVADDQGRMTDPYKFDVPVRVPNEEMLTAIDQMAGYAAKIQMRPGEQRLAIGVRDELAAIDSTLNLNVDVGGS